MLVWFEADYDKARRQSFVRLKSELGCDSAAAIYALLKYDQKIPDEGQTGRFYHQTKTNADSLYNFFLSATEGLNYLSALGWRLVTAFPQITSSHTDERGPNGFMPITTVSSHAVYCFKKEQNNWR